MSKKWLLIIPGGIVVVLLAASAVMSFGFRGGHHRHGMAKEFMEYRLEKLSEELKLDETQKAKLDTFKEDMKTIIDQRMEKRKEIHSLVKEELSKENPEFAKIRRIIDEQIDSMALIAHEFVGRVDEFYGGLTPEQKKILRDKIAEKMEEHGHFE